jgi:hypothetical protein
MLRNTKKKCYVYNKGVVPGPLKHGRGLVLDLLGKFTCKKHQTQSMARAQDSMGSRVLDISLKCYTSKGSS